MTKNTAKANSKPAYRIEDRRLLPTGGYEVIATLATHDRQPLDRATALRLISADARNMVGRYDPVTGTHRLVVLPVDERDAEVAA